VVKLFLKKIGGVDVLVNPQLIIEVLSHSTEKFDRDQKFKHYKSIESFSEYLLISQEIYFVVHYRKHNEKFWMQTEYDKLDDVINLTTIDCDLTLAEIYEDIDLPAVEI
jgi:Uma2 family endonuclease